MRRETAAGLLSPFVCSLFRFCAWVQVRATWGGRRASVISGMIGRGLAFSFCRSVVSVFPMSESFCRLRQTPGELISPSDRRRLDFLFCRSVVIWGIFIFSGRRNVMLRQIVQVAVRAGLGECLFIDIVYHRHSLAQ